MGIARLFIRYKQKAAIISLCILLPTFYMYLYTGNHKKLRELHSPLDSLRYPLPQQDEQIIDVSVTNNQIEEPKPIQYIIEQSELKPDELQRTQNNINQSETKQNTDKTEQTKANSEETKSQPGKTDQPETKEVESKPILDKNGLPETNSGNDQNHIQDIVNQSLSIPAGAKPIQDKLESTIPEQTKPTQNEIEQDVKNTEVKTIQENENLVSTNLEELEQNQNKLEQSKQNLEKDKIIQNDIKSSEEKPNTKQITDDIKQSDLKSEETKSLPEKIVQSTNKLEETKSIQGKLEPAQTKLDEIEPIQENIEKSEMKQTPNKTEQYETKSNGTDGIAIDESKEKSEKSEALQEEKKSIQDEVNPSENISQDKNKIEDEKKQSMSKPEETNTTQEHVDSFETKQENTTLSQDKIEQTETKLEETNPRDNKTEQSEAKLQELDPDLNGFTILNGNNVQHDPEAGVLRILFWHQQRRPWVEIGKAFHKLDCENVVCNIYENRNLMRLDRYDAIVFKDAYVDEELLTIRSPNQRYVLWKLEPPEPQKESNGNLMGRREFFNWTMTYRDDSDIVWKPAKLDRADFESKVKFARSQKMIKKNKKLGFAAWVVSNCDAPSGRDALVRQLRKYIDIVTIGKCGKYKCKDEVTKSQECFQNIESNFKFYLSFESLLCKDYITEKFYSRLGENILPVVYGLGDYASIAPPHSYVDATKFKTPLDLAFHLLYLDKNETAYDEYFEWKQKYKIAKIDKPWCKLCKKLYRDKEPKVYRNMNDWFITRAQCIEPGKGRFYSNPDN